MKFACAVFAAVVFLGISGTGGRAQQPARPAQRQQVQQTQQSPPAQSSSSPQQDQTSSAQQKQPPKIVSTTGLVHLVATVMDRRRNFITNLNQNDFQVLEDGSPQKILFFGRETDLPLRIGLLMDTSNSIRPRLQFEQDAAIDFLTSVIRHDKDMAFLVTFDNEPEVVQDFTDDVGELGDAIRRQRAGGGTALNDAIYMASERLINPPLPTGSNLQVRRVLVLISDGDDDLSDHALSDALEEAIRAEVAIYTISTNTDWIAVDNPDQPRKYHLDPGDKVLQEFSDESGGRAFFPYRVDDLAQSFVDIGTELRSQYFIAYAPTDPLSNGGYRKIQVDADRKGLTVRTKKGYYAAAQTPATPPGK
ncbi:MAG TPA: VWA domain-containing protein [Candidatus Acidoferrales bacterium]|nr:VWA domain-containing protein [Candidatus Acidoferrales bacterium]